MRNMLLPFLLVLFVLNTRGQQRDAFVRELINLGEMSQLPLYREGGMDQLSSYDRTGGNDDGFSGKYSAVRKEPGGLVMADLKGPGVVNRIWTPTPTSDTIQFFFDGETKPRIAIPFIELFTGKTFPFLGPLCGNEIGGYYCYLPIPYGKSLKIVYTGENLRFHQTQYRTLPRNEPVKSFSSDMLTHNRDLFERVSSVWNRKKSPLQEYGIRLKSEKINITLRNGKEASLFSLTGGGRVVGIELDAATLLHVYRNIGLSARWDGEGKKAFDLPLHDFMGFAFGKPAMRSILQGSDGQRMYTYLPMPFDRSAEISLRYDKSGSGPEEITVSGTVWYTDEKRNPDTEGKLYVQSRRHYNIPSGEAYVIADVKGRGHYVGTILSTQGLEEGSTWYFEGDDQAIIDGKLRLHGTGSEDYFNGGWYAVTDRWDQRMSLPIHGSLEYDQMTSRTGGYRFYLSDKLNFNETFRLTIEHQPDAQNNVKTDYTSVAFFYSDNPEFQNAPILIDDKVKEVAHRDKLTPQGMVYSLYWLGQASYEDPAILFSMKQSDKWFATIDPEAVPMVQIFLRGLDNGRYKLFVEYELSDGSGPFSIWQRSGRISEWLSGSAEKKTDARAAVYAGEIEITDEVKTITLRKKGGDTSVRIFSFFFERVR